MTVPPRLLAAAALALLLAACAHRGARAAGTPAASAPAATAPAQPPAREPAAGAPAASASSAASAPATGAPAAWGGSAPAAAAGGGSTVGDDWRTLRWGMTVEQVLAALPGRAIRIQPPQALPDGGVVAAGVEEHRRGELVLRVRFLFREEKLAMVSERTPERRYAEPAAYDATQKLLTEALGEPLTAEKDDALIDLRQTRWKAGASHVDLKYIPGVVVVQHYPAP